MLEALVLILIGVWLRSVWNHWMEILQVRREEKLRPFRWSCNTCTDGNAFECSSNDVTGLDNMILQHKAVAHDWRDV